MHGTILTISTLTEGIFDVAVMTKLLTKIGASLEYYEPYAMVKSYLYQQYHSDGIEISYTFETPRKRIPVIKGIPKVLKGGPPMKRGTLSLSDRGPIRLGFDPVNNVGASIANKGVLTSTTRTKTVVSKTASVPTIESLKPR